MWKHYVSHRLVIKDDSVTTKVCSAFDVSSKIEGPTLNDCLNPGPSVTEPLLSLILHFHVDKIVFIAYMKKTFLQICLKPVHETLWNFCGIKLKFNYI